MKASLGPPRRGLLAYEQVAAIGAPAVYTAFGDHLVFIDGGLYAMPEGVEPSGLSAPPSLDGARRITNVVGVEFGWRHLEDCRCELCFDRRAEEVA